ncbi:type 4a pilus biogenesis protein PilO [Thiorhodospira sibirica]|uniref:type 4a pilus biogenesis protein PilO n=1 Tax=Thiorhodospira sibirica TaxID=154347 RepID=UPI00022C112B|nr:type 4a pilus biogenesis protein PilO [Thiorhodospira sibirica]
MNMQMDLDLNNIDLKNIGSAPAPIKAIAIVLIMALIGGGGYYFIIKDQLLQLDRVEQQERTLRQSFEAKQRQAANLEAYKDQIEEMRRMLGTMLRQLPNRTEIPRLLVDISQTGLAAGLEIELFRPERPVPRGFYEENPIQLRMKGNYEQIANFTSGVAELPRIVTLHNVNLQSEQDGRMLVIQATARTYRYLEN